MQTSASALPWWKSCLKAVLPGWLLALLRKSRRLQVVSEEQRLFWPDVTFFGDGIATIHSADFTHEPRFARAYEIGQATGSWRGTKNVWRVHVQCWAADWAKHLPGDFVEC